MKNYWLHWIGTRYYTADKFIQEAQEYGVTRRISPLMLKNMQWGDTVFCIQRLKPSDKWGTIFARFPVEALAGLSEEAINAIQRQFIIDPIHPGGVMVFRENCQFITGVSYSVKAPLNEVNRSLAEAGKSPLMIGCLAESIQAMPKPQAMLYGVPYRPGFRLFDGRRFFGKYHSMIGRYEVKHGKAPGVIRMNKNDQFYTEPADGKTRAKGRLMAITSYKGESRAVREYKATVSDLISYVSNMPLPFGELSVTRSGRKIKVVWTDNGKPVSEVLMNPSLLKEHPHRGTVEFLGRYAFQTLEAKRIRMDKVIR